jgi:N-acetylmuramoyl-L-alanine amidase
MSISRRSFLQVLAQIPLWMTLPSGLVVAARLRVEALRHWPEPQRTRLVLDLSAAGQFVATTESAPPRIVLKIAGAELGKSLDQSCPSDALVERIRARSLADGVELTLDL